MFYWDGGLLERHNPEQVIRLQVGRGVCVQDLNWLRFLFSFLCLFFLRGEGVNDYSGPVTRFCPEGGCHVTSDPSERLLPWLHNALMT